MAASYMSQQTDMFLSGRVWVVLLSKCRLLVNETWPKLLPFTQCALYTNVWNLPICFETLDLQEKFQTTCTCTVKKNPKTTGSLNDM